MCISGCLQLDHEACENVDSIINPCCGELRELNSGHHHKIVEITENAGQCLLQDYTVKINTKQAWQKHVPYVYLIMIMIIFNLAYLFIGGQTIVLNAKKESDRHSKHCFG